MADRIVTVSQNEAPKDLPDNHVWITVKEKALAAYYIESAIRMQPDKLIISSELFGLFRVVANAAAFNGE